jgi:hypothetical protein
VVLNTPLTVTTPAITSGVTGSTITGITPSVSGGTGAYAYTDGTSDPLCTGPTLPTLPLPAGKITSLAPETGAHSVNTTGLSAGTYQYCIKVCDASGTNCAVSIHKVVVSASITPVTVTTPTTITGVVGTPITGNVPNATGGTSPYTYSNGSGDVGCVAPSGSYTALSTAGGSINGLNTSTGTHTITAPNAVGSYYYCIKVCDTSGTNCAVSNHKVTVTAVTCKAGYASPKIVKN